MKQYEFILAGGGVAGLSLAYHLINSPFRDAPILIVDRDAKIRNDRTLCFWTEQPTHYDDIVFRSWSKFAFSSDEFQGELDLAPYTYKMLRGIDFYNFVREKLAECPNVDMVQGTVQDIVDGETAATVYVDDQPYGGKWVFNSCFRLRDLRPDLGDFSYAHQYFKGWEIETAAPAFDPDAATLFDFRIPQENEMRFFYVLPHSAQRALVELVILSPDNYDQILNNYLTNILKIKAYHVLSKEGGVIPLTDQPFQRKLGQRIMAVGTLGGMVKPSAGYAFMRIEKDSDAILKSLLETGEPFDVPTQSHLFRLCDSLMLHIMGQHGDRIKSIFTNMFKNNPTERILSFLDETASPLESLELGSTLPSDLMLQTFIETTVMRYT